MRGLLGGPADEPRDLRSMREPSHSQSTHRRWQPVVPQLLSKPGHDLQHLRPGAAKPTHQVLDTALRTLLCHTQTVCRLRRHHYALRDHQVRALQGTRPVAA